LDSLKKFVRRRLWPEKEPDSILRRGLLGLGRYLFALIRELSTGEINLRAMSLVYTTVLSLVPMLGVAFALAKGLGIQNEEEMANLLQELFQPLGSSAEDLTARVIEFVENASGGTLAVISVGLLLLTTMSMAQKVENSFNFVWRVDHPRSFARRFSEYLSVILIGPTIMLVAIALVGALSSLPLIERLPGGQALATSIARIGDLTPYLMVTGAFTFLYLFIPNTKVRFRPALIGGLAAGIAWTASGYLFADFVATSARLQAIYSSFFVVFSAMIWLYLTWLIFLLGSQLAYYVQYPHHLQYGQRTVPAGNAFREELSLSIMHKVALDFAQPKHGWSDESLAAALLVPRTVIEPVIAALMAERLLSKDREQRLIPGRDPHHIALSEIVAAVRETGDAGFDSRDLSHGDIEAVADRIDDAIAAALGRTTLGELVDSALDTEAE
jgi:membrane protein